MHYNGLFIGLTTIDIQYFVDSFPARNVKVKTKPPKILVGGPATNAAVAFAHLNKSATLVSSCGVNSFRDFILKDFQTTNITHLDLAEDKKVMPVLASVITSEINGDRNIFTYNPEDFKTDVNPKRILERVKPDIVLLDGFYPEFGLKCAAQAKKRNISVVLDCGSWKPQFSELLKAVDIAICSEDFYPPECTNEKEVLDFLKKKKLKQFAISRGHKSILYFDGERKGEVEICKVKVADTLGAGDFLHGAFCFYYLQTGTMKKALEKASELASLTCSYKGTRSWLKENYV